MPAARSPMDGRNAYDDVRWRTTSAIHHLLASPPNPHRKTHRMPVSWCTIEADGDEAMRSSVRFIMGGITYGRALAHHQKVVLNIRYGLPPLTCATAHFFVPKPQRWMLDECFTLYIPFYT